MTPNAMPRSGEKSQLRAMPARVVVFRAEDVASAYPATHPTRTCVIDMGRRR